MLYLSSILFTMLSKYGQSMNSREALCTDMDDTPSSSRGTGLAGRSDCCLLHEAPVAPSQCPIAGDLFAMIRRDSARQTPGQFSLRDTRTRRPRRISGRIPGPAVVATLMLSAPGHLSDFGQAPASGVATPP